MPIYTAGRVGRARGRRPRRTCARPAPTGAATEQDVRLEVAARVLGAGDRAETERVLEQALARADAPWPTSRARVDAGVLPPNDLLSAQAQRAREAVRLIQAQKRRGDRRGGSGAA